MKTYQDLLKVGERESARIEFTREVIKSHMATPLYNRAKIADLYYRRHNVTIERYQKLLYDVTGRAIPDNWSANYKLEHPFFHLFVTQEVQYLLGNGTTFEDENTKKILGKKFEKQLQKIAKDARVGGVAYGFWNLDHLEAFSVLEFAGLLDEENGALMAGVRFWQIDSDKPLRATLYEPDGFTEYIWPKDGPGRVYRDKRPYILKTRTSKADGMEIYDGLNYPAFPIIPMWANEEKESPFTGLREQIDCYDLIKSGFADNVDEGSLIYWTLNNAGGMSDIDLAQFVQKMKTLHAATTDDNVSAESHNLEAPFQSRETLLARLRSDLYESAMALDVKSIADGAVTATQIQAAYEPLDQKENGFEYQIIDFIERVMELAGVEDNPTFTRSKIVNKTEEIRTINESAAHLSGEYVTKKILTLLGDGDQVEEIIKQMDGEELSFIGQGLTEE